MGFKSHNNFSFFRTSWRRLKRILEDEKFLRRRRLQHVFETNNTAWKVFKYGVISGPYFSVFGLNTEIYEMKHFSRSEIFAGKN